MDDDFLDGLSPEDRIEAINDFVYFGTAMIHEVNGVKRRVAPRDWSDLNAALAE